MRHGDPHHTEILQILRWQLPFERYQPVISASADHDPSLESCQSLPGDKKPVTVAAIMERLAKASLLFSLSVVSS